MEKKKADEIVNLTQAPLNEKNPLSFTQIQEWDHDISNKSPRPEYIFENNLKDYFSDDIGHENLNLIDDLIGLFEVRQFETVLELMTQFKKELRPEHKEILIYLAIYYKARDYVEAIAAIFDTINTRPATERETSDNKLPNNPKEYFKNDGYMKKLIKVVFQESIRSGIESLIKIILKRDSEKLKIK